MDNENRYGTLEMQQDLLVLLKAFHSHCKEYGIEYSLCSGSLLGAVRHGGFIPWDDDLDIIMDRPNYYKLKESFTPGGKMVFVNAYETGNWLDRVRLSDAVYRGDALPTLDVFILDVVPANRFKERMKLFTVLLLQGMIKDTPSMDKGGVVMKAASVVTWILGRPFSKKLKMRWYHEVAQWGKNNPAPEMGMWIDQFKGISKRYPGDILSGFSEHPFEDTVASVMNNFDGYLRTAYGDNYMTPPEKNDRVPIHMGV
ncbi:MAG: LicD family protein [Bacteroidales bacterium]|nr:LicD family protein [Bacteroidales bacterium]